MIAKITAQDLHDAARKVGLAIQHDCSGYRIVQEIDGGMRYVFPDGGICPTASKRACAGFLLGVAWQKKNSC